MAHEPNASAEAEAGRTSAAELHAIKHDLQALKDDMKGLLASMKTDGHGRMVDLKDRLRDLGGRAKMGLQNTWNTVSDQSEKVVETGRDKIRERPLTTVAIALLAGIVVGRYLRRG